MKSDVKKIKNNKSLKKKKIKKASFLDNFKNASSFTHLLIIGILLLSLFLIIFLKGQDPRRSEKEDVFKNISNSNLSLKQNVYGDHFANDLGVDSSKSNFYFDKTTTAYTYEPDYKWIDKGQCFDMYCGMESGDWSYAGANKETELKYCINNDCLNLKEDKIYYNNKSLALPTRLKEKKIENISIYPLESSWLIGFVFLEEGSEKGRVYMFDGKKYKDLDEGDKFPFLSLPEFKGARFGFGGDSDNYLVLYGGYKFLGYQVRDNNKYDIARFLGLRVSDGGFYPQAIKLELEGDTIWYLYSLDEDKPRLVKLWQNGSKSIKGSLSLREPLLERKGRIDSAYLRKGIAENEVEFILKKNNTYQKMLLIDNGFIQKDKYTLISNNILKEKRLLNEATFYSILACASDTCGSSIPPSDLKFTVSGDGYNYFSFKFNETIKFPDKSKAFHWKIESGKEKKTKNYSPWIDGLTDASYSWFE